MSALARAQAAWGVEAPDWIKALAEACDARTQGDAARQIGYSAAVVSNVLSAKYPGNLAAVERMVRGTFMRERVTCPVLGEISTSNCVLNQRDKFSAASRMAVRLHQTCPSCPNSKSGGKSDVE
jgi:hypothetical protein